MKIAISLVWVRPGVMGGVESYTRNILDGLRNHTDKNEYILICSTDNHESFEHYTEDSRFKMVVCKLRSYNQRSLLSYEMFHLDQQVSSLGVEFCFIPNSRIPALIHKNKYIITIHDLQPLHYPEYFSRWKNLWLKFLWPRCVSYSEHMIAISHYVKKDILEHFPTDEKKITVIYNSILPSTEYNSWDDVSKKYGIEKDKYFYTICSMVEHKNIMTLFKLMELDNKPDSLKDFKLVVSGVGGRDKARIESYMKEHNLYDRCIFTGFIDNGTRNTLIKNCSYFLFPSIFEGFGMPIIEAMELGAKVITTKETSIPEVSKNKCLYVNDPFDTQEWLTMISDHLDDKKEVIHFPEYDQKVVTQQYLDLFEKFSKKI